MSRAGEHFALLQGAGASAQRDDVVRPHQLLRVDAERCARPRAVARGRPDGVPRRRADPGQLREPGRRRRAGAQPADGQRARTARSSSASCRWSSTPTIHTDICRSATWSIWLRRRSTRSAPSTRGTTCRTTRCSRSSATSTADDGFATAEAYFGHIARRRPPDTRSLPAPLARSRRRRPARLSSRTSRRRRSGSPARLPVDAPTGRELAAVILAASIVGDGETSRLHRRLVRKEQIALSAGFGVNALIAGNSLGLGSVRAVPGRGSRRDRRHRRARHSRHSHPTARPRSSLAWLGLRPSGTGSTRWAPRPVARTRSRRAPCCSTTPRPSTSGCPLLARRSRPRRCAPPPRRGCSVSAGAGTDRSPGGARRRRAARHRGGRGGIGGRQMTITARPPVAEADGWRFPTCGRGVAAERPAGARLPLPRPVRRRGRRCSSTCR